MPFAVTVVAHDLPQLPIAWRITSATRSLRVWSRPRSSRTHRWEHGRQLSDRLAGDISLDRGE